MAWMDILKCSDGTFYIGSTKSLTSRLFQHQQGKGAIYTSNRLPVGLVYFEEYRNVSECCGSFRERKTSSELEPCEEGSIN